MSRRILLVGAGVAGAGVVTVVIGRRLLEQRRVKGKLRLADSIPVHSKWWRDERARHGEILYVAIGDSAAQGIGASLPSRGYVGIIAKRIRELTGRSVRVINLSQSGGRLREVLDSQLPALARLHPEVLTVAIGANDIPGFEAGRFEREARMLLEALPKHAIVADLPSFYLGQAERDARVASEIVRRLTGELGLSAAPLYAATRRQTVAKAALRDVAADFFHPNDRGYRVWASAFLPTVEARVSELSDRTPDPSR